jgi:ribonuclease R
MTGNGRKIRPQILALLGRRDYRPLDKTEIARALGLKPQQRVALRKELRELERAGEIARIRKNRYLLPPEADLVTGTLQVHQAGYGFLVTEKSGEADLFIAAENTGTALNGDRVVARISREMPKGKDKRPLREGRVIRILERAHDTIVGTLQHSRNFYYVVADDPRFVHNIYVQPVAAVYDRRGQQPKEKDRRSPASAELRRGEQTATTVPRIGDKVVVRLDSWESRHVNPEGEIIEVLGPANAPGVDLLSIIRSYQLPSDFPKPVLDEANRIPQTIDNATVADREDLREKFIVTIDPDDARDFDDAIDVERAGDHGWRLGVHIADVAAYVQPDSPMDREARRRGNSVYLPDRVIPMLPERLSNGICSLKPGVDRLTHSVFIDYDRNGRVKGARFAKTVIRSARRLTYKQTYAILKAPGHDQLSERLHGAWQLAALLRRKRFQHGALDLDFPEIKVRVDEDGKPVSFERVENDESHQLIEEFMLAANEAVARELKRRATPTIYRVHENPDPEKLAEYRELILSYNYRVGDLTHRAELQRFLDSIRGKPEEQALKIQLLKSLKRARYLPQPLGHYGLAKNNYLHFTSPIRRYADLVVHRTLSDRIQKPQFRADMGQLTAVAEHISTTERIAAEAEIEAVRVKKLEFFEQQLAERDPQVFRASVIDVRNYGLVIELPDVLLNGLIHISALADDFYAFDSAQRRLVGRRTRKLFSIGDELRVFVARVDRFKRQVDFALADQPRDAKRRRSKR